MFQVAGSENENEVMWSWSHASTLLHPTQIVQLLTETRANWWHVRTLQCVGLGRHLQVIDNLLLELGEPSAILSKVGLLGPPSERSI